ncbi:ATP-dependent zinc protease family protein [Spongorhabdus nitratireducens]
MHHRQFWLVSLLLSVLLAGCQSPAISTSKPSKPAVTTAEQPAPDSSSVSVQPDMNNAASGLSSQQQIKKVTITRRIEQIPARINDKIVLGITETGYLLDARLSMKAKMDTGAEGSSLDARNIQRFERDGKKWVRFDINRAHEGHKTLERPLERIVYIKRPGLKAIQRPVVLLTVRVGDITQKQEFSLTNRRQYEYPLIIGRTFLKDLAIIDSGQHHIAEPKLLKQQDVTLKIAVDKKPPKSPEIIQQPVRVKRDTIFGSVEPVFLPTQNLRFDARIDTGAKTSSLDARNIQRFKRDNKHWVRFELPGPTANNPMIKLEVPVKRRVKIKRHGADWDHRLVIELQTRVGSVSRKTEFTLRDRSEYDHPILLGYEFLENRALVDVSQPYLTDIFKQRAHLIYLH